MRLTLLILLAALMQVSAATFAQKVTLSEKNALLTTVFNDIRSQTGYDFIVTKTVMDQSKTITIEVKNAELADVLKQIFQDEPLDYQITDKSVLVKLKDPNLPDKLKNAINLNQIDVTGIVLDEQGRPVSGATVTVKNTSNAIITDAKGGFHLKNVADNATIVISFIGYQKQELPAQTDMGKIKLVIATNALDAVQVVAYGETTQRLTTGNISGVTAEEIERQPVDNPLLALEGKVPGLFVAQTNGAPNSAVTVQIQGQNSIQSGNDPLYVIDGVPYNSETMMQGGIGGTNPLSYVNPTDIQSIEVLKDAEATSIYGSRAANGAILITTKKGKAGTTKVDFDFQDGFSRDTRMIPLMNTEQYIAMREEAFSNDGTTPSANPNNGVDYAPDLTLWNTNSYTNWQKVLLGGTGQAITTRGSISGGNENTQFLISGNYNKESSIYPGNFSDQKSSVLVNLNNTSPNKKFKTEFSASYMYDNNSLPYYDPYQLALSLPPDAPQIYNTDGTLNWAPNSAGESSWLNPLAYTLQTYDAKTNNLVSSITLNYNILPGLNILSTFGYTNQQSYELSEMPLSSIAPEYRQYGQNSAEYTNSDVNSWNIEPQVTYKRQISKGTLDAVVGETFHQDSGTNQNTTGYGYNSDLNLADMGSASTLTATSGEYTYKYTAFFARTNYNWEDKYIVDASARRDGSSRFGSANQFHDFAAGGAAWIFSKEKLIEDNLSFLSFGKFKVSYGSTGNDQIGNYQYLSSYGATGPYQGAKGLSPGGLTNPFLQWELTKKANFGIDLGFLKDRILVSANYFVNRSSNELLYYLLPASTGFNAITDNFPATVQNSGLELNINTKNIQGNDFSWTSSFNLTTPQNKLIAFPELTNSAYANTLIIGQSIKIQHLYHAVGVDPATGVYDFETKNGQITSNPQSGVDNYIIKNTLPTIYGGFENSFRYRSFQLDVLFNFTRQNIFNNLVGNLPGYFNGGTGNQLINVANAWQQPGDASSIQKYTNGNFSLFTPINDERSSDAAYSNVTYFRLRNVSLSWQTPKNWGKKIGLHDINLFIRGQDLLTFSSHIGEDPETATTYNGTPPLTVVTIGIKGTL